MGKLLDFLKLLGLIIELKERINRAANKLFIASISFLSLSAILSFLNQDLVGFFLAGLGTGSLITVYGLFKTLLGWLSSFESSLTKSIDKLEKKAEKYGL